MGNFKASAYRRESMGLTSKHPQRRIIGLVLLSLLASCDSTRARSLEHRVNMSTVNKTEDMTVLRQAKKFTDLALDAPHPEPMGYHSKNSADLVTYHTAYITATGIYNGVHASLEVFNVDGMSATQYSGAAVWVADGTDVDRDMIGAGWMVSYLLYGDYLPRLTVYANVKGKGGCYNTVCPGFTQTHPTIKLGMALNVSEAWVTPKIITVEVRLATDTYDWQLAFSSEGQPLELVGSWKHGFFRSMAGSCAEMTLGGFASGPPDLPSPKMGNGHSPSEKLARAAGILDIMYYDSTNRYLNPESILNNVDRSAAPTYDVSDLNCGGGSGCRFYYGGNGGLTS